MKFPFRSLSTAVSETLPKLYNNPDVKFKESSRRVGLVAKKIGMMSIWDEWGVFTPVTVLQGIDNQVIRSQVMDGHFNVEIGVDKLNKRHRAKYKSSLGHFARYGIPAKRKIYSFPVSEDGILPSGLRIGVHHFVPGQYIDVQSKSMGKGFQGGMKRWGFKGLPRTHGVSLAHRSIGSTGNRHDPGKVFRGKKMPGRMGNRTVSVHSLKIMKIDTVYNLIYVKGTIPGVDHAYVRIRDAVRSFWTGKAFPEGAQIPFPTNFKKLSELPRELKIEYKDDGIDPLSRQRKEKTVMFKNEIGKEEESIAPKSMDEIDQVMTEMDGIYKTNFSDWIRDESNLSYICTIKRPVFMKEFRANPKLGMHAIRWITNNWSLTSIMEFILKMFPFMTIDSPEFADLVLDLTNEWPMDRIYEFVKLLLVGESANTCASFIHYFNKISRSDRGDLLVYLSNSLSWDSSFLRLFLLDFSMMANANGIEHRALVVLIHQSMDDIDLKYNAEKIDRQDFMEKSNISGIHAPPSTPVGTPPASSNWESSLKNEEDRLIRKLVSIQEFKVFLALFEVIMDIHDQHDSKVEQELSEKLLHELEL